MNKKIAIPAFFIMVLAQLYFPAQIIFNSEKIYREGKEFLFRTAPIDPTDPFRGKYIVLSFEETSARVSNAVDWNYGDPVYVNLGTNERGFATIQSLSKDKPEKSEDYVKAYVSYVSGDSAAHVTIRYPFDRFYMEESKAYGAEIIYNESLRDTAQVTYALVAVKNGNAVVKDVVINGVPVREAVLKKRMEEQDQN